jgi:hypothetical protein
MKTALDRGQDEACTGLGDTKTALDSGHDVDCTGLGDTMKTALDSGTR